MNTKTLYFLRHGQSVYNKKGILQGQHDNPLSEEGRAEVEKRASKFTKFEIQHIACSPLLRARQTASIINEHINVPITFWDNIQEMDFGNWETEMLEEHWVDFRTDFYEHDKAPPGGESKLDLFNRVEKEVVEICNNIDEDPVMVACHGMVMRILVGHWFTDSSEKELRSFKVPNLALYKVHVEYDENSVKPIDYEFIDLAS